MRLWILKLLRIPVTEAGPEGPVQAAIQVDTAIISNILLVSCYVRPCSEFQRCFSPPAAAASVTGIRSNSSFQASTQPILSIFRGHMSRRPTADGMFVPLSQLALAMCNKCNNNVHSLADNYKCAV